MSEENKQKNKSGNDSGSNEKKAKTPPPKPDISELEYFGEEKNNNLTSKKK